MSETACDVLVIGAGPAGLAAARRAAAHGRSVILLERDPAHPALASPPPGVRALAAHGRLEAPGVVAAVAAGAAETRLRAAHVVLAVGDVPVAPPESAPDGAAIVTAEALATDPPPSTALVAGGGPAGVAAAASLAAAGARVVLATRGDRLLTAWEADLAEHLTRRLVERGVEVRSRTRLVSARLVPGGAEASLRGPDGDSGVHDAARVVLALGRRPRTDGLGLETLGVVRDRRGRLQTDPCQETAVAGLLAAGAVSGGPTFPRAAVAEGRAAADHAAGVRPRPAAWEVLPRILPPPLEAAAAGLTEAEAEARGYVVVVGRAAVAEDFVKLVADREEGRLLGVHAAGPAAPRLAEAGALLLAARAAPSAWADAAPEDPVLDLALADLAAAARRG